MENSKDVAEKVPDITRACNQLNSSTEATELLVKELTERLKLVLANRPVGVSGSGGDEVKANFSAPLAIEISGSVSRVDSTNRLLRSLIRDIEL